MSSAVHVDRELVRDVALASPSTVTLKEGSSARASPPSRTPVRVASSCNGTSALTATSARTSARSPYVHEVAPCGPFRVGSAGERERGRQPVDLEL